MANGLDLKKVIEIAGGAKKSALNDYIVVASKPVDARKYYSSYNLDSVLAGTLKVDLRENDEILIGDSLDLYPLDKVKIFGDVINQGEFEYGSNLSISKLLYLAGGFTKEALNPGETKTINFTINKQDLSFIDFTNNWKIEEGYFEVQAGGDPSNLLVAKFYYQQ